MQQKRAFVIALVLGLVFCFTFLSTGTVSAKPEFKLKFVNYFPPPSFHSKICEEFIAELEKRTDGRIKIQYFAGGSLLKGPGIYKGVVTGIADIGLSHIEYTPGRFPITGTCELPLGYPSGWVSTQVANDFYNNFRPKEWNKVHVLWMSACGPNIIISKKPVRNLEDMKGLTIRAPGIVGNTIKALGATPAPTPIMEVYDAISKGVIDGVNTPFETLKTFRFAEVAKYTTASWQVGNVYAFYVVMNKDRYKKLPPDLKAIFDKLCGEFKEKMALMWNIIDFRGEEFAKKKGVEIIDLSPEEATKWRKATAPVIENYVKMMVGKGHSEKEVRGWIKFVRDRIDYWTAKQIQLGIKSPTGPVAMRP